jgi:hypothetical protein
MLVTLTIFGAAICLNLLDSYLSLTKNHRHSNGLAG